MEVKMKLQQMIFAAFASTVLLIGGHSKTEVVASLDQNPIMNIQNLKTFEETIEIHVMKFVQQFNDRKEELKQAFSQLTQVFSVKHLKNKMHFLQERSYFQLKFIPDETYQFKSLTVRDDFYPSSYKGIESIIKEEEIIIYGELKPLNI